MRERPKLPWRGFVIVRTVGGVSRTLVGLGMPRDKTTVYDWTADPPYPITFATRGIAQVWLDLMPTELRAQRRIVET